MAGPLSVSILRAHLDGPLRLPDLRERIGGAAQTTLRGQVGNLRAIGALERHVRGGMPYTVENELTDVGRGILDVAEVVEAWLTRAPQGPIAFGSEPAKGAIRSLVGGWGSTVLRALAAHPLSLTELSGVIPEISYPSLERRLSAMRASRQVEVLQNETGKSRPYAMTDWTRQAVGPLIAAGRCECEHIAEVAEPLTRIDIEAAFLLAVPLVLLPIPRSGSCRLVVDTAEGDGGVPAVRNRRQRRSRARRSHLLRLRPGARSEHLGPRHGRVLDRGDHRQPFRQPLHRGEGAGPGPQPGRGSPSVDLSAWLTSQRARMPGS